MMDKGKYLFFDIECSNGYNICSFGYCVVSEKMRVVDKRDILINPESKFVLSSHGNRPKIQLAYPNEMFYKQDAFPTFYQEIKELLTTKGYVLIGHSIQSDLYFLAYACKRYNLPQLEIEAYDSQKIYQKFSGMEHIESLEKILEHLEIDSSHLILHRSCDDAVASFLVLKEICKLSDQSLPELLSQNKNYIVSSKNIIK